jgi:predicted Zn-ribbon and HTH transcriptional regulator
MSEARGKRIKIRKDEICDMYYDPLMQRKPLRCSRCGFEFEYLGVRRPMRCPIPECSATAKDMIILIGENGRRL